MCVMCAQVWTSIWASSAHSEHCYEQCHVCNDTAVCQCSTKVWTGYKTSQVCRSVTNCSVLFIILFPLSLNMCNEYLAKCRAVRCHCIWFDQFCLGNRQWHCIVTMRGEIHVWFVWCIALWGWEILIQTVWTEEVCCQWLELNKQLFTLMQKCLYVCIHIESCFCCAFCCYLLLELTDCQSLQAEAALWPCAESVIYVWSSQH